MVVGWILQNYEKNRKQSLKKNSAFFRERGARIGKNRSRVSKIFVKRQFLKNGLTDRV